MNGKIIVPNVQFVVKNYLINTIMSNFIKKIKKFQNKVDIYYIVIDSNFETNMYNIISEYCNEHDIRYIDSFINTNDKIIRPAVSTIASSVNLTHKGLPVYF